MSHNAWVGSKFVSGLPDTGKSVLGGGTPRTRGNPNATISDIPEVSVQELGDASTSLVEHVKKRKQKDSRKQKAQQKG